MKERCVIRGCNLSAILWVRRKHADECRAYCGEHFIDEERKRPETWEVIQYGDWLTVTV